jgi:hypothetical protein
MIPLQAQLAEVNREIALRERVYPRWIEAGKIPQAKADRSLEHMRAVAVTLRDLIRKEELPL